ncbi:putative ribonuclease H-like domain-containing protein [Tanacetum coccineum]
MSTVKLPLLKKGEYDIWAMKMEHYLAHTDYPIWEVIQKGNGPDAIKSRFGGNDESKKMQKYLLKQQFEGFTISNSEGLHKGYDRFQSLLSQLEVHGAGVSNEDANQKFLRSLPSSWSQVSLVMRTKQGIDDLGFDDLYNNLRVFESDIQGSNVSSSSSPNVAFVSSESTNSTNNVSTASGASSSTSHQNTKRETSSSYTDDLMYSFFANQSSGPQLDHEDLEQINEYDLEEMDLKWQVAMILMRLKKFFKKTGRKLHFDAKEPVGFDKKKVKDNGRRAGKTEESNALVTLDREGIDWIAHAEEEDEDFALMAFNNADTKVLSCSPTCVETYSKLKKLYDEQRDQPSNANVEILAYSQGLKKVEAQLVTHQNNQLWYEQKIRYMKIDLDDKTDVLTYHKKLLEDALKEKEELKIKFANWQNSSKNLSKLLNTQMSASDKFGLGYGDYRFDGVLSYENEVLQSVFFNNEAHTEDSTLHDRNAKPNEMHAVPSPMTGNYMPSGPDVEIDESQFTYGPKTPQNSDSDTRPSNFDSSESNSSAYTTDHVLVPKVTEPIVVCTPKVWTDAPIIEEYESDSNDEGVSSPSSPQFQPRILVQEHQTSCNNPKVDKNTKNGLRFTRRGLGYGGHRKGCFVCGSLSHLIRDCTFHEKRIAKETAMNKKQSQDPKQKKIRPSWNNTQRLNHKNQFVPIAVLTRSGTIPFNTDRSSGTNHVSTARQNVSTARQNCPAIPTRTVGKVSTVSTKMNDYSPNTNFKTNHSSIKRPLSSSEALATKSSKPKVHTVRGKQVSVAGVKRTTAVKASAGCIWRPKRYYDAPHRAMKNKVIVDSGCSRHMTRNKSYLVDYQDYHGGPVAFGGNKGQITGKGKIRTGKLDFVDVCFVKELQQFNLFSVSQMCDKKNKVLFSDTECLVVSPDFKLPDENQVLLRVPRQHNMYSFSLENYVPSEGLTCLIAKASSDESNKWHRRLGHVNFKNLNKLVKGNLVRGPPSKIFQNDHTCGACQKGKQHKALIGSLYTRKL